MPSDNSPRRTVDASLLRVIVDQFVVRAAHPRGDVEQFEKLALGLIENIDADAVAGIARPLCLHPETPPSIFASLFDKGGECARLAFEYAPWLSTRDMLATAEHGPTALAVAIAHRRDLDREIVNALASRSEAEALRALAANGAAHFDASARRALAQAGRDDLTLARILLDRDDLEINAEPLFLAATRLERIAIVLEACRSALVKGASETVRRADPSFVVRLEAAALQKNRDEMARLLADALDCRKCRARAIVADAHGEALALALTALGVGAASATRLFLCADPAISHDADRVRALLALMRSTPQRAAARIMASITGAPRNEKESVRRPGWREEGQATGVVWRRTGAPRASAPSLRKIDQSA